MYKYKYFLLKDKTVINLLKHTLQKLGSNDNPTTEEFKRIYRKLLICHEIVYKNDRSNCIPNDTGVLTVSSRLPKQQCTVDTVFSTSPFKIESDEFNYHTTINENLEKFDQHLYSYVASTIECKLIENIKWRHKQECSQCIDVFYENELANDDFVTAKNLSDELKIPCLNTVHIVKASNRIFNILQRSMKDDCAENLHDMILKTIMSLLPTEKLYTQSNFESHKRSHKQWTHKEKFIYGIVSEYMRQKSCKIGNRITEEEKGEYIRHSNRKLVHFSGQ